MKISAVSGDLVVKLALVAGVGVAGWLAYRLVRDKATQAGDALKGAASAVGAAINPVDPGNLAYGGVNAIGAVLATNPDSPGKNADGSWSFGGWLYDKTH